MSRGVFMRLSKWAAIFPVVVLLASTVFAAASDSTAPPILPKQFGGWQMQGAAQPSKDPAVADPSNAALLKEYGFIDFESATYKSDDGRTLKIRAARFDDGATGAFGAYTFYLQSGMAREEIGDRRRVGGPASVILSWARCSRCSVQRAISHVGGELARISGRMPRPVGNAGNLPPILAFMPHHGYQANTEKYAEGPLGLSAIASPIPAKLIDFSTNPEVVLGQYSVGGGEATLMLIEYPTPALAAEHLRRIDAANHAAQPQAGVESVENIGPFFDKRTGPIWQLPLDHFRRAKPKRCWEP